MILADLGAEVIHVEKEDGDDSREFGPFVGGHDKNRSGYFISLNRNKKSLVLNLKAEKGKEILRELIRVSDVVLENFRPDTMQKLDSAGKRSRRSTLALSTVPSAASGMTRSTVRQSPRLRHGRPSVQRTHEHHRARRRAAVSGRLLGWRYHRGDARAIGSWRPSGTGSERPRQYVDIAMVDSLFSVLENAVARYVNTGETPGPLGGAHPSIAPFQGFQGKDGQWVIAPSER